ncbi:IS1595 family transposase [Brevundimonas albigilva]|uniref:IS1595 family transposase n=1 Tax=Brevundimonas albigilva TaxID=1312364 RepID=UPI00201B745E|nr:IS1595 family transposase [Brevundimonas albigilva]UQV18867.1 IS1595 family transposase [Brevundimonas albigilva]
MIQSFKTLPQLFAALPTEQSAIDHLTAIRWANGKFCPLCGNANAAKIGTLTGTNTHKCYECRKRFSIKVGTIFQDTKLPLRTWYAAIWMITNHPKGIASTTLATDLGITQKSAWFVLHRLRHAARTDSFNAPLSGEVEVDETAVGGLEKNKHESKKKHVGRGLIGKTVVMGLVQRGGQVRAGVIDNVKSETLHGVIQNHVEAGATVYTDEHRGYRGLNARYDHQTVNHGAGEYVSGKATTNAVESLWALFKRQYHGTHHFISPKHMDAYLNEMTFRLNRRDMDKGQRTTALLSQIEGPMPWKVLTA